jgi:hypothetical protein
MEAKAMKSKTNIILSVLGIICFSFLSFSATLAADEKPAATQSSITGTVTEEFQIATEDGDVYDVTENEKSDELMEHVGETVTVTGTLSEKDGAQTITIMEFKVVDK